MASSSDEDAAIVAIVCAVAHEVVHSTVRRKAKRKRAHWVRQWVERRTKEGTGAYNSLLRELQVEDPHSFRDFLRMDVERFHKLLELVGPSIKKQDTVMRQAIAPGERLALTLRFLASGNTFRDLQYLYRIPPCTISGIIHETCKAIHSELKYLYLQPPQSQAEWEKIAADFMDHWQFPNCLGAMDGKHIAIKAPHAEGSSYFNYKHFHSIILLALVSANLKFLYVDVGANGRAGDAGVFRDSPLYQGLEEKTLKVPHPRNLPGTDPETKAPYVIVADDAFPLKTYLLKPYSDRFQGDECEKKQRRIFNYRLSRARRCSENAFGLLVNRFGVFKTTMQLSPAKATVVTQAALCLHNYLIDERDRSYSTSPIGLGATSSQQQTVCLEPLEGQGGNRNADAARSVRDHFRDYFNGPGAVAWQDAKI